MHNRILSGRKANIRKRVIQLPEQEPIKEEKVIKRSGKRKAERDISEA
jgi:hypothetical protein